MTFADLSAQIKKQPIGFACGLICVVLGGVLYYRSSNIDESQATYETKSEEATKIMSNVNTSKNLPEQVEEIQKLTKDLENRLIRAGQLAVNLQYFYKLEAETEVKLLDIRQNAMLKNSTTYGGVPYNVTVQGSHKQVMTFLNRLENGRHFCHFSSVIFTKISGGIGASSQNIMTLTLTLELLGEP